MLRLESLSCGYGEMTVVHGLTLDVPDGEITALLGANGAGKSSTIMCIAGHVAVIGGRIIYQEMDITQATPMERVSAGIAVVPEGRRLFPSLTVEENLVVGGYSRPRGFTREGIDQVLALFPRLGERLGQLAGSLSGGEQQRVAPTHLHYTSELLRTLGAREARRQTERHGGVVCPSSRR